MADVFVSYARSDKARVAPLVAAIEAKGWTVWWDPEISAGQEFDRQIAAELKIAAAVLVVWTPNSVESRWVRGEAREGAERGILVPVRFERADVPKVARELKVNHVLEGSVRKAGGRVRITAQLVDGSSNDHVWAERYDRDLNDIFALQDEISAAIVKALKLRLLPEEKKAIEQRGTDNVEAYNLYPMGPQLYVTGQEGDARRAEAIIRL